MVPRERNQHATGDVHVIEKYRQSFFFCSHTVLDVSKWCFSHIFLNAANQCPETEPNCFFRHEGTETYRTLLLSTVLRIYLVWKIRDSANYCLLKSSGVDDCICCNVGCTLISAFSCLKIKGNPSSAIWQRQPGLGSPRPLLGRSRNHSNYFALGTAPYFDLFQKRWETNEVTCKTAWIVLSQRTHQGQHKGKHL